MDRQIIDEKIDSLRKCMNRIETKRPKTVKTLISDLDLQDILSVNLQRAVQLNVDIGTHIIAQKNSDAPKTMADTFDKLLELNIISNISANSMKKAVGFRNIAVHDYQKVNWEIVFHICHENLADFKRYAREINEYMYS